MCVSGYSTKVKSNQGCHVQVSPAELEALLHTHPNVLDVAVIGIPNEDAGEVPKGFIVPKGEVTETEIVDFVAERVAPYKKTQRRGAIH